MAITGRESRGILRHRRLMCMTLRMCPRACLDINSNSNNRSDINSIFRLLHLRLHLLLLH